MRIATHDGPFHADEVFATVVLRKLFPGADLVRSRNLVVLADCQIVYDVGGVYDPSKGRFDHHMAEFNVYHENGIKLSSLGLIWQVYGADYCSGDQELAELINQKFVMAIDANDNGQELFALTDFGVRPNDIDLYIKMFYPAFDQPQDYNLAFSRVLDFATGVLERVVAKYSAEMRALTQLKDAYSQTSDKRLLVLSNPLPFGDFARDQPELLYVIAPNSIGDSYNIRAITDDERGFNPRQPFPASWAGLNDTELEKACGVVGAKFCHNGRWLAGAYNLEAAQHMAELSLNQ
ncbi:MYG1 family protein [Candidatus Saccharibacteria bacterium]|nr:MYG1 family protein [Candidatus Saccharibacteria bacterium]MCB9821713.1 MYG1 family protein [Candidatus Nomurabacteria bacterium]